MYCKIYINVTSRINIELDTTQDYDILMAINDYFTYDKIIINKKNACNGYMEIHVSCYYT